MKIFKKIIAVLCVICMCPSLVAFASDDKYLDVMMQLWLLVQMTK